MENKSEDIEKVYVSYDIAFAIMEIGFNEPCITYFRKNCKELKDVMFSSSESKCFHDTLGNFIARRNSNCNKLTISAPTRQEIITWFEEKWKLEIRSEFSRDAQLWTSSIYPMDYSGLPSSSCLWETYYRDGIKSKHKALDIAILFAIEYIKMLLSIQNK
jgi:hypothetical protein